MNSIRDFYKNKSIFITGGSGLLGQLTIERLLRCCDVNKIYLLIRHKKGESYQERIRKMFEDELFDKVRDQSPDFLDQIVGISGDCGLPGLGVSEVDRVELCNKVNIVFHSAASINMKEKMSTAIAINVEGTQHIVDLCHEIKQLDAFVYVSTAYSNCNRDFIEEKFYEPLYSVDAIVENSKKITNALTNQAKLVNSYFFTKNLSEKVVQKSAADIPTVVFRPALIIATHKEPVPGWINNRHGPVGIQTSAANGMWKIFHGDPNRDLMVVPADKCVSIMLASAWDVSKNEHKSIPIYNFVTPKENLITNAQYFAAALSAGKKFPSVKAVGRISTFKFTSNTILYKVQRLWYHTVLGMLKDFTLIMRLEAPYFQREYKKIDIVQDVLGPFFFKRMEWSNENSKVLWRKMSQSDKEWLNFDMRSIDWDRHIFASVEGMRKYLLKDDPATLDEARKRQRRLKTISTFVWVITVLLPVLGLVLLKNKRKRF